jgi:hypothetical protein
MAIVFQLTEAGPVRLALPPLPLAGLPEPLRLNNMDFDAATVDAVLERLTTLRGQW